MKAKEDNVFCKGCSETLKTFLGEMADHNAEVVCPHCGKVYTRAKAEALAKAERCGSAGRISEYMSWVGRPIGMPEGTPAASTQLHEVSP